MAFQYDSLRWIRPLAVQTKDALEAFVCKLWGGGHQHSTSLTTYMMWYKTVNKLQTLSVSKTSTIHLVGTHDDYSCTYIRNGTCVVMDSVQGSPMWVRFSH